MSESVYLVSSPTCFFISKTFISEARLKLAKKIKHKLSNTLRLNFCYLKITYFLHLHYHPNIIGDILKKCAKIKSVCLNEVI